MLLRHKWLGRCGDDDLPTARGQKANITSAANTREDVVFKRLLVACVGATEAEANLAAAEKAKEAATSRCEGIKEQGKKLRAKYDELKASLAADSLAAGGYESGGGYGGGYGGGDDDGGGGGPRTMPCAAAGGAG